MSDIQHRQNVDENRLRIAAFKRLYTLSKRYSSLRWFLSVGAGIAGTILLAQPHAGQEARAAVVVLGVLWPVVDVLTFKSLEERSREKGVRVQEEFDCRVFEIPWSADVAGSPLTLEEIREAAEGYGGTLDSEELRDWYPTDPSPLPPPLDVLLCQRTNAVWSYRVAERFAVGMALAGGTAIFGAVAGAVLLQSTVLKLLEFLSPWAGLLCQLFAYAVDLQKQSRKMQAVQTRVEREWDSALKRRGRSTSPRNIQDELFRIRCGPSIPDWYHYYKRPQFQKDAKFAAEKWREAALARLGEAESQRDHKAGVAYPPE